MSSGAGTRRRGCSENTEVRSVFPVCVGAATRRHNFAFFRNNAQNKLRLSVPRESQNEPLWLKQQQRLPSFPPKQLCVPAVSGFPHSHAGLRYHPAAPQLPPPGAHRASSPGQAVIIWDFLAHGRLLSYLRQQSNLHRLHFLFADGRPVCPRPRATPGQLVRGLGPRWGEGCSGAAERAGRSGSVLQRGSGDPS